MSLKRAAMKIALAFAAAKGVEAFRKSGGLRGVQDMLAGNGQAGGGQGGMSGRIGGAGGASAGGLGSLLESLGRGGATDANEGSMRGQVSPRNSGLDGILGGLAGALGGAGAEEKMGGLLGRTRAAEEAQGGEEEVAGLMLRATIQAARADGQIDDEEMAALHTITSDATEEDRRFINQALDEPVDAEALAREVPEGQELRVYSAALAAIEPDNRAEAEYLHALAQGLHLDRETVDGMHDALGKPRLYS